MSIRLGVNIDHVATIRQARRGVHPDPVHAAILCQLAGADGIVAHLREDRRHIQDHDVFRLKQTINIPLNLEMSCADEIVQKGLKLAPERVTLVPERRQELTTEGGLEVTRLERKIGRVVERFRRRGIQVSLFVDSDQKQIETAHHLGAQLVELHTGQYANASSEQERRKKIEVLERACAYGKNLGLRIHAGHGLNYWNIQAIAQIGGIEEVNIGHAIVARAVLVGIVQAVREMKELLGSCHAHCDRD